jgi:RNA processing factor Prp31
MTIKSLEKEQRNAFHATYDGFMEALKKAGFINVGKSSDPAITGGTKKFDLPEWVIKWRKDTDDLSVYYSLKTTITEDYESHTDSFGNKQIDELITYIISFDYSTKVSDKDHSETFTERKKHRGIAAKFHIDDIESTISQMTMAFMEFYGKSLLDFEKLIRDHEQYSLDD